jgi:hypothetical protein
MTTNDTLRILRSTDQIGLILLLRRCALDPPKCQMLDRILYAAEDLTNELSLSTLTLIGSQYKFPRS